MASTFERGDFNAAGVGIPPTGRQLTPDRYTRRRARPRRTPPRGTSSRFSAMSSPADSAITPSDIGREIRDFDRRQERRRKVVPRATLVGVLAGLVASGFRLTLEAADRARDGLFRAA